MATNPNKLSQFWQELKRRNVVRVITVYAGAAFVILELVDMIIEPFGLPPWTFKLAVVILSIGFIVAIILSWIYDIHPEGGMVKTEPADKVKTADFPKSSNSWKIATYVSIVIIIGLLMLNLFGNRSKIVIDETLNKSVAVLPFRNLSGDPEQEFICEGLTEEVIHNLYKVEAFDRVPSVATVLNYKNTDKRLTDIAEELQVNYILISSFKRMEGMIRFSVTLIEARSDKQVWQRNFDKHTEEISAIPSNIALQIADHLKAFVTDPEKQRVQRISTTNEEAYNKYHLGRFYQRKGGRNLTSTLAAIELFIEAISLDPNYALAHTYLARAYLDKYWFYYERNSLVLKESKDLIEKALKIDPELPDAYIILAQYYYHGFLDYANALEQLEKVSLYAPDHPEYLFLKALIARRMGEWETSIELFQAAHNSDPMNIEYIWDMSESYIVTGNFQEAIKFLDEAILIDPYNPLAYEIKIFAHFQEGSVSKAKEVLKESESHDLAKNVMKESIYLTPITMDIYDENYQKALDYLSDTDWEGHFNLNWYQPKSLFKAELYKWMNLTDISKAYFDSTRITLEMALQESPEDHRIIGSLGIAYAGLGDKEKAIQSGKRALGLYSVDMDAWGGLIRVADLAWIYVMVKEYDTALEQLEIILSRPGPYSAALLKLDPKWKPLWDNPKFIRLIEKYSKKGVNSYDS